MRCSRLDDCTTKFVAATNLIYLMEVVWGGRGKTLDGQPGQRCFAKIVKNSSSILCELDYGNLSLTKGEGYEGFGDFNECRPMDTCNGTAGGF